MFGRHLKPEYKAKMYQLVDEDHQITGTKYTSMRDPVFVIMGASVFLWILWAFITSIALPFFNVAVPEVTCIRIYAVLGLAGTLGGYYMVTEPDIRSE